MKEKTLASPEDIIDAVEHVQASKYQVIKGGIVIHETDDLNDAQRVCYAHHAVISGKGIMYFFGTTG